MPSESERIELHLVPVPVDDALVRQHPLGCEDLAHPDDRHAPRPGVVDEGVQARHGLLDPAEVEAERPRHDSLVGAEVALHIDDDQRRMPRSTCASSVVSSSMDAPGTPCSLDTFDCRGSRPARPRPSHDVDYDPAC